jgi:hypothetical protein
VLVRRAKAACVAMALAFASAPEAAAQEKAATCILVDGPPAERAALERLVASEVERHPSHRAAGDHCAVHLKVELVEVDGDRFLTGRVGGEVPERVHVDGRDGKALESATSELLRIVLGNDPVVLRAPGGQTWFSERVAALKSHGRGTFDVGLLQTVSLLPGSAAFLPGLSLAYAREAADVQVGIQAEWVQNFDGEKAWLALDTEVRLDATMTLFFSRDADVSGFAGLSLGLAHQRFSGPRAVDVGGGHGTYSATGPSLGLRAGVEFFRTTDTRAFALFEALVPAFLANDDQADVVHAWVPTFSLGAGARF